MNAYERASSPHACTRVHVSVCMLLCIRAYATNIYMIGAINCCTGSSEHISMHTTDVDHDYQHPCTTKHRACMRARPKSYQVCATSSVPRYGYLLLYSTLDTKQNIVDAERPCQNVSTEGSILTSVGDAYMAKFVGLAAPIAPWYRISLRLHTPYFLR